MGKQFNLKDERAIELAQNLAEKLGKSVTATIREALEEKMARREAEREARIIAIREAAAAIRAKIPPELLKLSSKEWMDAIYDEHGLPI